MREPGLPTATLFSAALTLALALAAPGAVHAQVGSLDLDALGVVPFFGLPIVSGQSGSQQALGAHLVWPAQARTALAARYEVRWLGDGGRHGVMSLDGVRRLAGGDTASVALTAGWARWLGRDHASAGVRLVWPFFPPDESGSFAVQGWVDVRYVAPGARSLLAGEGLLWTELMVGVVVRLERRRW